MISRRRRPKRRVFTTVHRWLRETGAFMPQMCRTCRKCQMLYKLMHGLALVGFVRNRHLLECSSVNTAGGVNLYKGYSLGTIFVAISVDGLYTKL